MQKILHTLTYNNIVPIIFGILFLGSTAALAANPVVRDQIISEEKLVRSVDNSYILNKDLDLFNTNLVISAVEEDDEFYYVSYSYQTIAIENYVWKDQSRTETLAVSKASLNGRDLGLYVAKQLGEVIQSELSYLSDVQGIEKRKGVTQKVVTTQYSGLVGKLLKEEDEVFENYSPIIPEPELKVASAEEGPQRSQSSQSTQTNTPATPTGPTREEIIAIIHDTVEELLAKNKEVTTASVATAVESTTSETTSSPTTTPSTDTGEPPSITISGNNPAEVEKGALYTDLGIIITDDKDDNLGHTTFVDGVELLPSETVEIDTTTVGDHEIVYTVLDTDGNSTSATRIVTVFDPNATTTPQTEETATTTPATEEPTEEETATSTPDTTVPTITLIGQTPLTLSVGDTYTDEGATANDDTDGDITANITTLNSVDTTTAGTYTVTYNVSDEAGNAAEEVVRTVTVEEVVVEEPAPEESATTTPSE